MPDCLQNARIGGSGYTVLVWNGDANPIKWCRVITETAPAPVGGGVGGGAAYEPIQPLDANAPVEFGFSPAHGAGTLGLGVIEEWDYAPWQRLMGYGNTGIGDKAGETSGEPGDTLYWVIQRSMNLGGAHCVKLIRSPGRTKKEWRKTVYFGCQVVQIGDNESIAIETRNRDLEKVITVAYRHRRHFANSRNRFEQLGDKGWRSWVPELRDR